MDNQAKDAAQAVNSQGGVVSSILNILWVDAAIFTASKKRIVFRFYTQLPDLLTLHGWTNDDDTFPDNPDVIFNIGQVSAFLFGDKTYFGNLVLRHTDRKKINTMITSGSFKYVLSVIELLLMRAYHQAASVFPASLPGLK
jgi:hypothetical protein